MASRAWLPAALRPSSQRTTTPSAVTVDAHGPRALEQAHPSAQELVLEGGRHLWVLLRQHLLARHDQRHLRCRASENMWTNSTPVTPEPITTRCSGQVGGRVGLAGGEHAIAVDLGPVGEAGPAARGEEDGVGLDLDRRRRRCRRRPRVRPREPAGPRG